MDTPSKIPSYLGAEHYRGGHKSNNGCPLFGDNAVRLTVEFQGTWHAETDGGMAYCGTTDKTKDLVMQKCDD